MTAPPRPLNAREQMFYSRLLRAFFVRYTNTREAALCLAFAQHEGGPTELATVFHNPFGYKWIPGTDDTRYNYMEKPGNKWDVERGEFNVRYRMFDCLVFAVRSWRWQVFEAASNSDILPLWTSGEPQQQDDFAAEVYRRWSLNPEHSIVRLYHDWLARLAGYGDWSPDYWPFSRAIPAV